MKKEIKIARLERKIEELQDQLLLLRSSGRLGSNEAAQPVVGGLRIGKPEPTIEFKRGAMLNE